MKSEFRSFGSLVTSSIEVLVVAVVFVIASRYWAIEEHVAYLGLLGSVAIISISRLKDLRFSTTGFLPLLLFLAFISWIVVSSLWSPNFHLSFARSVMVAILALVAIGLGFSFTILRVALGLIVGTVAVIIHATLVSGWHPLRLFYNHNATQSITGSAEPGLFTSIGDLSFMLGVALTATIALTVVSKISAGAGALIGSFLMVASLGVPVTTMFVALAGAVLVSVMIYHARSVAKPRQKFVVGFYALGGALLGSLFVFFPERVSSLLGEDGNLSGRLIIWDWYFEAFLWEPVFGIGWGNTYNWPLVSGDIYPTGQYFVAHNGFLDIGLVTGTVGVALIVLTLAMLFIRGASHAMNVSNPLYFVFVPALVGYICLNDIMATSLPRYIGVFIVGVLVGLVTRESSKAASHSL